MEATSPDWSRGVCVILDLDPELFFLTGKHQVAKAKTYCAPCQIGTACMEWATVNAVTDGVFGGLTPAERNARGTTGP